MFGETRNTKLVQIFKKIANKYKVFQSRQQNKRAEAGGDLKKGGRRCKTQIQNMLEMTEIYKRDFSKKYTSNWEKAKRTPSRLPTRESEQWSRTISRKQSSKILDRNKQTKQSVDLFQIYDDEADLDSSSDSEVSQKSESVKKAKKGVLIDSDFGRQLRKNSKKRLRRMECKENLLDEKNLGRRRANDRVPDVDPAKGGQLGQEALQADHERGEPDERSHQKKGTSAL